MKLVLMFVSIIPYEVLVPRNRPATHIVTELSCLAADGGGVIAAVLAYEAGDGARALCKVMGERANCTRSGSDRVGKAHDVGCVSNHRGTEVRRSALCWFWLVVTMAEPVVGHIGMGGCRLVQSRTRKKQKIWPVAGDDGQAALFCGWRSEPGEMTESSWKGCGRDGRLKGWVQEQNSREKPLKTQQKETEFHKQKAERHG